MLVRFVQRYATFFALLAGLIAYRVILPNDAPWWLELTIVLGIAMAIYLLLYKDGVTANRPKRR